MANTDPREDAVSRNQDVNVHGVFMSGVFLAVGLIVAALFSWGLYRVLVKTGPPEKKLSPMVAANLQRTPPEPRLEPNPLEPREKMRAEEELALHSYGWVDKQTGAVRIPIDRAMDLIAERGLPPAKAMPATAPLPSATGGAR